MIQTQTYDDKLEKDARSKIIDIAKNNNVYFVVWQKHFEKCFCIYENHTKKPAEIYYSLFENFNDLTENDKEIAVFRIDDNFTSWQDILLMILPYFPKAVSVKKSIF